MTKITLYYANWCGHCRQFKPTWDGLKKTFEKNNVEYAEFNDETNSDIIKSNHIMGFPTIKIQNEKGTYDYNGPRDADSILHEVIPELKIQSGGAKKYYIVYH